MKRTFLIVVGTISSLTTLHALAQAQSTGSEWKLSGNIRIRPEYWDWFGTAKADGTYFFTGSQLRLAATRNTSQDEAVVEIEGVSLAGLPSGSVAAAPQGQLGVGAAYRAANGSKNAGVFVKQGFYKWKQALGPDSSIKLGRFEFSDGVELASKDSSMSYLKRERIGQRLIGPFGWTQVGRSFDGVQFSSGTHSVNSTLFAAQPTRGVFSTNGMDSLGDIKLVYLSGSQAYQKSASINDTRWFGIYYTDDRKGALKTDNRTAAARAADTGSLHIATVGGNFTTVKSTGIGKLDGLVWFAGQFGQWGALNHNAHAYAAEAGFQPKGAPTRLWLRCGYYHASGDGNSADNQHNTFFPVLPTPRPYARFPFFSETNLNDAFVQAIMKPGSKTTIRTDFHVLALSDGHDLWYGGGGAYDNNAFGYSGRPSGGLRSLEKLLDLSIDVQLRKTTSIGFYLAVAEAGNVAQTSFTGKHAALGYVELNQKF